MRLSLLLPILCALLLFGCDPKVNQREARYDPNDCPTCLNGTCAMCKGTSKCSYCDGKGKRITSTKNFTGEGVKLVDYEETCSFCKGTGKCHYSEGTGKCGTCEGSGKSSDWEKYAKNNDSK